ncbi:MAG: 6-carboxytetrahydropterin synthase QueD [Bryobacteraceae bacterium]|nr:6-carboxytetrahydropterin synthase QueD [Solibacteraceae bacterium]MCL4843965.1 6-carboxytetrahydropterin synthase QueD [Bryobacteraceae bacterium]MCO5353636.1 6-carboxytetrahydropterin synthase QueD [Bryobacteraceae bacterium]
MFELRVEHSFPAGHALRGYNGKCANIHGHNYRVQVAVAGERLNEIGLLMDFGDLKKALRAICEELDHQFLNELPPFAEINASAENIALYIHNRMKEALAEQMSASGTRLIEVSVQETDTAWAIYRQ